MNAPPLFSLPLSILLFACPLKSIMPFMQAKGKKKCCYVHLWWCYLFTFAPAGLTTARQCVFSCSSNVVSCAPRCLSMPPPACRSVTSDAILMRHQITFRQICTFFFFFSDWYVTFCLCFIHLCIFSLWKRISWDCFVKIHRFYYKL